jgi:hypothetical protein
LYCFLHSAVEYLSAFVGFGYCDRKCIDYSPKCTRVVINALFPVGVVHVSALNEPTTHACFGFVFVRFRNEYRLERKLMSDVDPRDLADSQSRASLSSRFVTPPTRHSISRVVVVHNDKVETFVSSSQDLIFAAGSQSSSAVATSPSDDARANDFFDNDSFWSGSITWY